MKKFPHHPFADEWPIDTDKVEAIAEGLKSGMPLRQAIVIYDGHVLDGRQRQLACEIAGVQPHYVQFNVERDGDPWLYVLSCNNHRRDNSDPETNFKVAARTCNAMPSASNREVAHKAGFSHTYIAQVRKKLAETSEGKVQETRKGADGKTYPAKAKANSESDGGARSKGGDDAFDTPQVVDRTGALVPKGLRDAFCDPFYEEATATLESWMRRVAGDQILYARLHAKGFLGACESMRQCLVNNAPHSPCANCEAAGCDQCYTTGFVSELQAAGG